MYAKNQFDQKFGWTDKRDQAFFTRETSTLSFAINDLTYGRYQTTKILYGSPDEEPNMTNSRGYLQKIRIFICLFLYNCIILKAYGVNKNIIRLKLFPLSLINQARSWLQSLLVNSITSWVESSRFLFLRSTFLQARRPK